MFNKLYSSLFEVEETTPPPATPQGGSETKEKPAPVPVAVPTAPVAAPVAVPHLAPQVDEEMAGVLVEAIEKANLPGFDYIEFRNSLVQMASTPVPEQQKFFLVFTTAKAMGLTKAKLLEAVDHYQGILDDKKAEFQGYVEHQQKTEIGKREERCTTIDGEVQQLVEQMQAAQSRIQELQGEQNSLRVEITEQSQKIQTTAAKFDTTWTFVSGRLQDDRRKIDAYIPE